MVIGSKGRAREMRVFLFENVMLFTDPIKRDGQLPIYQLVAQGRVSDVLFLLNIRSYSDGTILLILDHSHKFKLYNLVPIVDIKS